MSGNRHQNLFTRENSAILLVDYQEKFAPVLHSNDQTIKNIKFLLSGANIYKVPIFVSEQVPEKLGPTISDFKECLKDYSNCLSRDAVNRVSMELLYNLNKIFRRKK